MSARTVDHSTLLMPGVLVNNSGLRVEQVSLVRGMVGRVQPVEARDELLRMLDV